MVNWLWRTGSPLPRKVHLLLDQHICCCCRCWAARARGPRADVEVRAIPLQTKADRYSYSCVQRPTPRISYKDVVGTAIGCSLFVSTGQTQCRQLRIGSLIRRLLRLKSAAMAMPRNRRVLLSFALCALLAFAAVPRPGAPRPTSTAHTPDCLPLSAASAKRAKVFAARALICRSLPLNLPRLPGVRGMPRALAGQLVKFPSQSNCVSTVIAATFFSAVGLPIIIHTCCITFGSVPLQVWAATPLSRLVATPRRYLQPRHISD